MTDWRVGAGTLRVPDQFDPLVAELIATAERNLNWAPPLSRPGWLRRDLPDALALAMPDQDLEWLDHQWSLAGGGS